MTKANLVAAGHHEPTGATDGAGDHDDDESCKKGFGVHGSHLLSLQDTLGYEDNAS